MCTQFVVVILALTALVVCDSDEELYKRHKAENNKMPCRIPQPRVISWEEIFTDEQKPKPCEVMLPHVSVLYRCDFASGCCDVESKSCQPVETENVILVYKLFRKSSKFANGQCADFNGPRTRYMHIEATNHTRCACKSKRNQPK